MPHPDSFGARGELVVGATRYEIFRLDRLGSAVEQLPFSLRILLENLLRHEDGVAVTSDDIAGLLEHRPASGGTVREIAFRPARVVLQDFTGVPALVDLAAMRDAMAALGGDPARVDPLLPVELVIDHSIQVDAFGTAEALAQNQALDYGRNGERYAFLRWGQQAFRNLRVVPPNTGIIHQVNLEYLARVVCDSAEEGDAGPRRAYPDTVVGTDSHTPMVNGLGVLGWGVGGIEAEAAMLGQPLAMLQPEVIGVRLTGALADGVTATDLVLTVTERLRRRGVVGRFVEFFGPGLAQLGLADRATIGNMAPEYGATCGFFPIDAVTLDYLRLTGRPPARVALVEAYAKAQRLWRDDTTPDPHYDDVLDLPLDEIEPSVAGPRRPQDRIPLARAAESFTLALPSLLPPTGSSAPKAAATGAPGRTRTLGVWGEGTPASPAAQGVLDADVAGQLEHGAVVIAAITSCTNTSNPAVMIGAGLLARKAVERGLVVRPWVKTSLAPGSRIVSGYLAAAGLTPALDALGFQVVGYGCTTCIGNSGPLPQPISEAIAERGLVVCSVLSGNRNFEGRINSEVRANFLMSPPLVVAYALAGRIDVDLATEPLGEDRDGMPVYLRDLWPSRAEVDATMAEVLKAELFATGYADVFRGDARWQALPVPGGERFAWDPASRYVRRAPYFDGMPAEPPPITDALEEARVLLLLGDSVTTDHISPAGSIRATSPAGEFLRAHGVAVEDFNSYGARRGDHEVMTRGTFANARIRNGLVPGIEGGVTEHLPSGERMSVFAAAARYAAAATPLVVIAGREYGSGSSRDWAAKGPLLLGVRAVIAESYERIHRSNLVGMGILPLQFLEGENAASLGLDGRERYRLEGIVAAVDGAGRVRVIATRDDGREIRFEAVARVDTPQDAIYYRHGGILPYVLRQLRRDARAPHAEAPVAGVVTVEEATASRRLGDEPSIESFPASDVPGGR